MPENMDKWASGNRKIAKSGHRVAAEMIPFPRRWHGSMISANLEAIWGMSVQCAIQRFGIQTARPGNHRPDGPNAYHALTIGLDYSTGADQRYR